MPFPLIHVIDLLRHIEAAPSKPRYANATNAEIQQIIRSYIAEWFEAYRSDIDDNPRTLLAILSTLLPQLRPDRVYGYREGSLAKVLVRALWLENSHRRTTLEAWRTLTPQGDLGTAVGAVVKLCETDPDGGKVSVEELNTLLDMLAARSNFSSEELRKGERDPLGREPYELLRIYNRLNSVEAKWVTRVILKNLSPVVMPETATLQGYHFILPKIFVVQGNLERACAQVCNPELMQIFTIPHPKEEHWVRWCKIAACFIKPQVGVQIGRGEFVKAHSCAHAVKLSAKRKMIMERKYDGEYCQIHIDLSQGLSKCFKIYSKSGRDSTQDRIGIHNTLRCALKVDDPEQRQFKEKCIIVGELLVYNSREQVIKPFDYLRRHIMRAGRFIGNASDPPPSPNSHLMIVLFDVLLVDDKSYLHLPLSQRRTALEELIISKKTGWCEVSQSTEIDFSQPPAAQRLLECFGAGIKMRWEGFVLKPLDSPYLDLTRNHPDKTTKGYGFVGAWNSWIKLKKDYIQGLGDTADFAVVGGAFALGRSFSRGQVEGGLRTFHVAVLVNKEQVKTLGTKPRLKVLFEVSYSISKLDLEWIQRIAYLDAAEYEPEIVPVLYDVCFPDELREVSKPTHIFMRPLIFEIMGGGFEKQTDCSFYTPRHPRVTKIHWDREFTSCVSFDELQNLAKEAIEGNSKTSQEERLWISRLQRGDEGKQIEDSHGSSRKSEPTPLGHDMPRHSTEQAQIEFDSAGGSTNPHSLVAVKPPAESPRLELTSPRALPLVPESTQESPASQPPLPQLLASDPSPNARNRDYDEVCPLVGARVYLLPTLFKFDHLIEKLNSRGIHNLDRFEPDVVEDSQERKVLLVDPRKRMLTRNALRALEEKGRQWGGDGMWEVWDWKVVDVEAGEGYRWSVHKVFDV